MAEESIEINAGQLRAIVQKAVAETIELHRASKSVLNPNGSYIAPTGEPTDEEIDDFLFSNPLFDSDTVQHLTDPGLLGFFGNTAKTTSSWVKELKENSAGWASNNSWLGGDAPFIHIEEVYGSPSQSNLWTPETEITPPGWIEACPSYLSATSC